MQRYEIVSGVFFTILSLAQLTRALFRWPVRVDGLNIPVWCSAIAFLITGALALWAFRSASRSSV